MIFRQLFEPLSSSYTYLLGCEATGQAVLIDPVIATMERDIETVQQLGLSLAYVVDTHIHADHITSAFVLRQRTNCKIACPAREYLPCADIMVEETKSLAIGSLELHALHTPGHTSGHFSYLLDDMVFTGDSLLIDGCGRTDFQNGSAEAMYHSVHDKLFKLPDDCLVYPGHDYHGRQVSTIGHERATNARLGNGRSFTEFEHIMNKLHLSYPTLIDHAVPVNRLCGEISAMSAQELKQYASLLGISTQG